MSELRGGVVSVGVSTADAGRLRLPPRTLGEGVEAFLVLHCGRLSASYREWCARRLASLVEVLGADVGLGDVEIWHLELWFSALSSRRRLYEDHPFARPVEGRGLSPSTLHGYVRVCKTFFRWLASRRFVSGNAAELLRLPEMPELPPRHASVEEVDALLVECGRRRFGGRNVAAVRLMAFSGLRVGELVSLTLPALDLDERLVLVRGKGRGGSNKSRVVPMDGVTVGALRRWVRERPGVEGDWLFVSGRGGVLGSSGVRQMMRVCSKAAGVDRVISPHMLRHWFGFNSTRLGMPMRVLQQILGHEDGKTTEVYAKFSAIEVRDVYDLVYNG